MSETAEKYRKSAERMQAIARVCELEYGTPVRCRLRPGGPIRDMVFCGPASVGWSLVRVAESLEEFHASHYSVIEPELIEFYPEPPKTEVTVELASEQDETLWIAEYDAITVELHAFLKKRVAEVVAKRTGDPEQHQLLVLLRSVQVAYGVNSRAEREYSKALES